ncbi:MAG: DNA-binding response regulator [Planctomycetes bacterium GWF2_41_51]|nr:MAG: DNA-binding response regulator [Planctomycetes bacterium GWF2_41_51]HBG28417.1 DNA-binding response regulator [Phycisphaerales bacterium]
MALKKKQDNTPEKKTQILIVDDHPIVRDGLASIINHEQDLNVCGEAEDAFHALKAIEELKPDVVVTDISLKNSDGIELTKSIKAGHPKLFVIVLSIHDESVYAERALLAGAKAYLMKDAVSDNIVQAIRTVLNGEIFVSDKILKKFLHKIAGSNTGTAKTQIDNLSDRELEIFRLIGEGLKASLIAKQLHLSIKTIETYRTRIKEKLDIVNASELLQYSIRWAKSQDRE